MFDLRSIFARVLLPVVGLGVLVAIVGTVTIGVTVRHSLNEELQSRAELVAATLEASAAAYGSVAELMAFVDSLGEHAALDRVALLEPTHLKVVAATQADWLSRRAERIAQLAPARTERGWSGDRVGLPEDVQAFVIPVAIANASIADTYGGKYLCVVYLDGSEVVAESMTAARSYLATAGAGGLVVMTCLFLILRRRVLLPLKQIHRAVNQHRPGERLDLGKLFRDEIGRLGDLLEHSYAALDQSSAEVALLSLAARASSNEFFVIDGADNTVLDANPAGLKNLGYALEEIRALKVEDVAPSSLRPEVQAEFLRQLKSNGEISSSYRHLRKDGSEYEFEFKATRVQLGEGHQRRVLLAVIGTDISERIERDRALKESEHRLRMALKGASECLFDLNVSEEEVYLSELGRSWFGTEDECLSLGQIFQAMSEEHRTALSQGIERAISDQVELSVELHLTPEGQPDRWLAVRGRLDSDRDGLRIAGFATDITRRKVAEELLESSVARLSAVLNHVADGVGSLTREGHLVRANPRLADMLQIDEHEIAGYQLVEHLVAVSDDAAVEWQTLVDEDVCACVLRLGSEALPVEISLREMPSLGDEAYTVVMRDVSAQSRHEAELRQAMAEAEAASQAKAEFLATMSHEIRTPMNGVLGMTQLLMDMELTAAQRESAEVILSSGESLLALINDILDFSKIEAGKLELERVPFDLGSAVREVMELLSTNARRKGLDMYVDLPHDDRWSFRGDVGRLRQVLLNLVGNAVKFTQSGHVLLRIRKLAETDASANVRISVVDTGVGIDLGDAGAASLFESFTQADASTTRRFGGTGLGLAISKQLIELMGGRIGVESNPGDGAEFWIELPMERVPDSAVLRTVDERLKGLRALVIDDNPVGLTVLSKMCRAMGLRVDGQTNPELVLAQAHAAIEAGDAYDLILLDFHMPGMDGCELARSLAADEALSDIPRLMLSSSDVSDREFIKGFAMKPIMRDGLARLLSRALFVDGGPTQRLTGGDETPQFDMRILLAEDNPVNQRVAVKMLEKLGCRVDVAGNGREAVEMWSDLGYDLILMDCQMPEVDGLAATREIRRQEIAQSGPHVPIVALTANAMKGDQEDCLAAGMNDYASKPIKLERLAELLEVHGLADTPTSAKAG